MKTPEIVTEVSESQTLSRDLGAFALFGLAFGSIVGVSWVVLVGDWILGAGSLGASIAFAVGGLLLLPIGLCYVSVGQRVPATGGEVIYALHFFGGPAAFFIGLLLTFLYLAVCAFEAISLAWLAPSIIPGIQGAKLYSLAGFDLHVGDFLLGAGLTVALGMLQYRGVKNMANVQNVIVWAMIISAAVFLMGASWGGSVEALDPLTTGLPGFAALLAVTPLFFAGFNTVPQALGESSDEARRSLPIVVVGVIVGAALFHVAVIFATALVIPAAQLPSVEVPVATAFAAALGNDSLARIGLIVGFFGLMTTWISTIYALTRVLYAMARARYLPAFLGRVSQRYQTPAGAIGFVTAVTLASIPVGQAVIEPILTMGAFCVISMFVLVSLCTVKIAGIRASLPSVIAILATVTSLILLGMNIYALSQGEVYGPLALAIWLIAGAVYWALTRRNRASLPKEELEAILKGNA